MSPEKKAIAAQARAAADAMSKRTSAWLPFHLLQKVFASVVSDGFGKMGAGCRECTLIESS